MNILRILCYYNIFNLMNTEIYISLGCTCAPRTHIKNHIGLSSENGYLTCPFDLCITNFEGLYDCIESDFQYFFEGLRLIPGMNADGDRTNCGVGGMNITNHYNMVFNHEGSTHSHLFSEGKNDDFFYIKNDFENFRKRYLKRIENFQNYINNYNTINFVYTLDNPNETIYIDKLKDLLLVKYHNKTIHFIEI